MTVTHLRGGGTSLVLALSDGSLPWVIHWGPDLGDVPDEQVADLPLALRPHASDSPVFTQESLSVLPELASGWLGRPGLSGSRSGQAWAVRLGAVVHTVDAGGEAGWRDGPPGASRVRSVGTDESSALEVGTEIELHPSGVVRLRARVRNLGEQPYELAALEPVLPVPADADEILDLTGRHAAERRPQRRPFDVGAWVRESRGGRPGHDSPTVLCAGRAGFAWRTGRVWGLHVAFSGNQVYCAERAPHGWRLLRGAELLAPGEVVLARDEAYESPWLVASWGEGLDALAGRIHRYLRARPEHPRRPRPVLVNTWEAVYFDHDLSRLTELAERAASIGVERFVLDDGWFRSRRDDRAGLGDWYVDEGVWPDGLHPLVDRVHSLGMEFGLWFEPEMINLSSDLARAHPDWVFDAGHGPGLPSRHQHVLDLGHDGAFDYLLERISTLVSDYRIAYLKWDHNRPLLDAGHQPGGGAGVHRQTLALYRLLRTLRERHPGLEIESCAGGGGRIDLGILEHTDRLWASDCIDPHERQDIQRWTSLLLPPELVGTHVGSPVDHTTRRAHALSFRAGIALWGHFGIEQDLTRVPPEELAELQRWVHFHRDTRSLLHHGEVVHGDVANPALRLDGVVGEDRRDAVYALSAAEHSATWPLGRVSLPGLEPTTTYRVVAQPPGDTYPGLLRPDWMTNGVQMTGRLLEEIGVQAPVLHPDHLVLLRAQAVEGSR